MVMLHNMIFAQFYNAIIVFNEISLKSLNIMISKM